MEEQWAAHQGLAPGTPGTPSVLEVRMGTQPMQPAPLAGTSMHEQAPPPTQLGLIAPTQLDDTMLQSQSAWENEQIGFRKLYQDFAVVCMLFLMMIFF